MAEALVDEIDHPDTGLVSRDFLRAELQSCAPNSRHCVPT